MITLIGKWHIPVTSAGVTAEVTGVTIFSPYIPAGSNLTIDDSSINFLKLGTRLYVASLFKAMNI